MKKSTPTPYKQFIENINQSKNKLTPPHKIKNVGIKNNNIHIFEHQRQSPIIKEIRSIQQLKYDKQYKKYQQIRNYNPPQLKSPTISKKAKLLCYQKFINQITKLLTHLFKTPTPQLLNTRLSYIDYLQSLKSLKMIHQTYQPHPNDTVSQLWSQQISGSNIGTFIITITSILGLYYEQKQNQKQKFLKNKYQSLRYTRLQLNKKQNNKSQKQNQFLFIPQISDKSRKLAKSTSNKCNKIHHHPCNNPNIANTARALTQRINGSTLYDDHSKVSIDQYTDQNLYQNLTQPNTQYKPNPSGTKRSQILYQNAKQKSLNKKLSKTTQQIDYQRNITQLTFKPKIIKIKNKQKFDNKKCTVKGQKNIISRMIKGRVQRQVRKIIYQKGIPYNQKLVDQMRKQKYQEITSSNSHLENYVSEQYQNIQINNIQKTIIPKLQIEPKPDINAPQSKPATPLPEQDLIIDVYISEDHKEKLIIRKGEPLQEVATRFIQQNGIAQQKKQQLIQLLEVSITHALCPIDQLAEEEDELASARSQHTRQYLK